MSGSWCPEADGRDDKIWILDWEIRVMACWSTASITLLSSLSIVSQKQSGSNITICSIIEICSIVQNLKLAYLHETTVNKHVHQTCKQLTSRHACGFIWEMTSFIHAYMNWNSRMTETSVKKSEDSKFGRLWFLQHEGLENLSRGLRKGRTKTDRPYSPRK